MKFLKPACPITWFSQVWSFFGEEWSSPTIRLTVWFYYQHLILNQIRGIEPLAVENESARCSILAPIGATLRGYTETLVRSYMFHLFRASFRKIFSTICTISSFQRTKLFTCLSFRIRTGTTLFPRPGRLQMRFPTSRFCVSVLLQNLSFRRRAPAGIFLPLHG